MVGCDLFTPASDTIIKGGCSIVINGEYDELANAAAKAIKYDPTVLLIHQLFSIYVPIIRNDSPPLGFGRFRYLNPGWFTESVSNAAPRILVMDDWVIESSFCPDLADCSTSSASMMTVSKSGQTVLTYSKSSNPNLVFTETSLVSGAWQYGYWREHNVGLCSIGVTTYLGFPFGHVSSFDCDEPTYLVEQISLHPNRTYLLADIGIRNSGSNATVTYHGKKRKTTEVNIGGCDFHPDILSLFGVDLLWSCVTENKCQENQWRHP